MPRYRPHNPLTYERAHELLRYDPERGVLIWRVTRGVNAQKDTIAGSLHKLSGYWSVGIDGVRYALHRVIWLMQTGKWPVEEIDHANRQKGDNRWGNLREATRSGNTANIGLKRNNTSGARGVKLIRGVRWRAVIRVKGVKRHLGYFSTREEASQAYEQAAREGFGQFAGEFS